MEMALRTHIVRKMINGRILLTPEFKEILPGGADSLSFLEVWGMPEGTIFNVYTEYLKMTKQGIPEVEIIKELENASNISVHPKNIEAYIKLRIKRGHRECSISDEFIDSMIYFIPIWIEEEKGFIKIVQPQIDLIKKLISEDFLFKGDRLFDIINSIEECKPPLGIIKAILGNSHDVYLSLSNEIVSHFQSKTITYVNLKLREQSTKKHQSMVESVSDSFMFGHDIIAKALDVMHWLNDLYMDKSLRIKFEKNFEDFNTLAKNNCLENIYKNPKSKFEGAINKIEDDLIKINSTIYFEFEIKKETQILNKIERWHPFRSQISKKKQIHEQTERLNKMLEKSESEKRLKIIQQQEMINIFREKIRKLEI